MECQCKEGYNDVHLEAKTNPNYINADEIGTGSGCTMRKSWDHNAMFTENVRLIYLSMTAEKADAYILMTLSKTLQWLCLEFCVQNSKSKRI